MKIWKRLLALLLSGAMALSLFACTAANPTSTSPDGEPSGVPDPSAPSADPSASPEIVADLSQGVLEFSAGMAPTDVLLTVNGDQLTADLFLYILAMNCSNIQQYLPYFGQTLADVADVMLEETVSVAVYHALLRQKAAELGCLLTDSQTAEIDQGLADPELEEAIPYWGLTQESARFILSMTPYYNNVLEAATHEPSSEELSAYITEQKVYRVKHILLKTVDDNRQPLADDVVAGKRTQAEDFLAQLQSADDMPALFDQLMNEHSEDGRTEDGALAAPDGYLAAPGDMVAAFEEASLALEEGGLSGIVETEYGYHIILRLPLTEEDMASYRESYRPDALEALVDQWQQESVVVQADALSGLNAAEFYDRLAAYQEALAAQDANQAPVESGGVG